jgi:hypothetical protein
LMRPVTGAFVAGIRYYVAVHGLDLVHFRKGERKDDIARRYLGEATRPDGSIPEGILLVGRAQEKALVFGTQKRRNPVTGASYAWLVREPVLVNHFYFYGFDDDFGPFFLKFCSYFPYTARLCCFSELCNLSCMSWCRRRWRPLSGSSEPGQADVKDQQRGEGRRAVQHDMSTFRDAPAMGHLQRIGSQDVPDSAATGQERPSIRVTCRDVP